MYNFNIINLELYNTNSKNILNILKLNYILCISRYNICITVSAIYEII